MAANPQTTENDKKMNNFTICRICEQLFVDPRRLSCGHTYCFKCINKEARRTQGSFVCPTEDGTTVQRTEIDSLPVNPVIANLVKNRLNKNKLQGGPKNSYSNAGASNGPEPERGRDPVDTGGDPDDELQIFISQLPLNMPEQLLFDTLWDEFTSIGSIKIDQRTKKPSISLHKHQNQGQLNGNAVIKFEQEESVMRAIELYNKKRVASLNNAQIYVKRSSTGKWPTEELRSLSISRNDSEPNDATGTDLKIWIQIEGSQTKTITMNTTSIFDNLKTKVFQERDDNDLYAGYHGIREMKSKDRLPESTTSNRPIVFRKRSKSPLPGPAPTMPNKETPEYIPKDYHIIIDNSNVFIGAQNIRDKDTNLLKGNPAIRVNVGNLAKVIEAGKLQIEIRTRLVGGCGADRNPRVWKEWEACGYRCIVGERTKNDKEGSVDDMLHAQIYNLLHDYDVLHKKQILVLVTGDGNKNNGRVNFPMTVERALTRNWKVELWSWKESLNQRFYDIQKQFPTQMEIKYFDDDRKEITFEQKRREN